MKRDAITRFLAEKALGWELSSWREIEPTELTYGGSTNNLDGTYRCWIDKRGNKAMREVDFDPFTNIAHAFLVVEALEEKGIVIDLSFDAHEYLASFWNLTTEETVASATSSKAPEAITLAATRALATPEQLKGFGL